MPADPTGTSRSSIDWPCSSFRSRSSASWASATARMFAVAVSSAASRSGSSRDPALRTVSSVTRIESGATSLPPTRASISATASSPPRRTSSMIAATGSLTSPRAGWSARTSFARASGSLPSQTNRLNLIARPPGGGARRGRDFLANLESVLLQRPPRRHQVDDAVGEADQWRQLHRALHLDHVRVAAGLLEVAFGGSRVFGGDAHPSHSPLGLAEALVALAARQHHPAGAIGEVEDLVDDPVPLLFE